LSTRIAETHRRSRETYGAPRIHAELRAQGIRVGCKRVARLMRAAGLHGVSRRNWVITTVRDREARPAPDLVERNFAAAAPNRLWVADLTYIPTWAGFLYLAVVLELSADGLSAGRWKLTCAPNWCSRRSTWRSGSGARAG
jgi:putative transposase